MVNSLENIDKSKVSADRIEGLDAKIQEELSTAITGAASTIVTSDLTANRAVISNANGKVSVSSTTSAELGYVHGVTSAIQTQLGNKQDTLVSGTNIKTINGNSVLGSGDLTIDSGTVDVDNKSITKNISDELQTVGVINSRDSSTAIKTWTGTKAQYDALKATPSWYAWVSDGTTYFTQSATPSVGDTVYDSNKNVIAKLQYKKN